LTGAVEMSGLITLQLLQSLAGRPTDGTWNWTGLFSAEYQQTQDELLRAQLTLSAVQQFNASVSVQVTMIGELPVLATGNKC